MQRLKNLMREGLETSKAGCSANRISSSALVEKILSTYYSHNSQSNIFDGEIREKSYESDKGDVLFPVEGVSRNTIRSLILARKFEMKGYNPVFVTHYGLNHATYIYPEIGDLSFNSFLKKKREIQVHNLIEELGYEVIEVDESDSDAEYETYDLEANALACTKKHFRRYSLDLNEEEIRSSYSKFIRSGKAILDALNQLDDSKNIKAIITHDPAYLNGVYGKFSKENDICSYSVSWAWNQKKVLIGNFENRNPLGQFTNSNVLEEMMSESATEEEIEAAEKVIEDRSKGKNLRTNHKEFSSGDIDFSGEEEVYALFTNLLWDASLEADDVLFEDPFSWLEETIEYFRNQDSKKLIIKTHPAEEKRLTDEKVFGWLQENYNFKHLETIDVLSPKTDVDPYDLMSSVDAGIVYNSTTGMEMASQDIPVIVVGDTHYRDLGFTVEPEDKEGYIEKISEDASDLETDSRKAKKYINFLFNRKQIDFQYIKDNNVEFKKIKDEDIKADSSLDLIVEKIMNGEEVFYPE